MNGLSHRTKDKDCRQSISSEMCHVSAFTGCRVGNLEAWLAYTMACGSNLTFALVPPTAMPSTTIVVERMAGLVRISNQESLEWGVRGSHRLCHIAHRPLYRSDKGTKVDVIFSCLRSEGSQLYPTKRLVNRFVGYETHSLLLVHCGSNLNTYSVQTTNFSGQPLDKISTSTFPGKSTTKSDQETWNLRRPERDPNHEPQLEKYAVAPSSFNCVITLNMSSKENHYPTEDCRAENFTKEGDIRDEG